MQYYTLRTLARPYSGLHKHTHKRLTALLDFDQDYLGEMAPER